MPIAAPVTAAITGLSQPISAFMNANDGASCRFAGRLTKSSMSLPEVKIPGWPVRRTARTASSSRAASNAWASARYIAPVSAFFFSGRAISIVATPSMTAVLMAIPVLLSLVARRLRSDALEDPRRALAGADAHRHHAVPEVAAAQCVDDRRRTDRAGGAERVAERDRAAHRVDLRRIEPDGVDDGERLRGERLVELDPADVVELQPRVRERRLDRLDRADSDDLGRNAAGREADETSERRQVELLDGLLACQDQRAGAVARLRAVARGDAAHSRALAARVLRGREHGSQLREPLERGVGARAFVERDRPRPRALRAVREPGETLEHIDRRDLLAEPARRLRLQRARARLERERVLPSAPHLPRRRALPRRQPHPVGDADVLVAGEDL